MFDNYICSNCGNKYYWQKPEGIDFPPSIEMTCEECNVKCTHTREPKTSMVFEIQAGRTGNASNGYTNTITDHGSSYAPKKTTSKLGKEFAHVDTQGRVV